MNPLQKAWLKLLKPLQYIINEKMAKRSGLLGKIGKFFLIGPREFGVHPSSKVFIFMNRRYMYSQAFLLHKYSVVKAFTQRGYHTLRPFKHLMILGPTIPFIGLFRFVYYGQSNRGYEPDRISHLQRRMGNEFGLPINSMNQRTSAHYIEINHIYGAEMLKRYSKMHKKIIDERNKATEQERKTRYADSNYEYIPMVPVSLNSQSNLNY